MRPDLAFRSGRDKRAANEPDLIRRHRPDYLIVVFMVFLMMLGLVVLYSINPALNRSYESSFIGKQVLFLFLGLGVFFIASRIPLSFLQKIAPVVLAGSIILGFLMALLSLLPGTPLVYCYNGACRWLDLGIASFQPAELMKLAILLYLAVFLAARMREGTLQDPKRTLLPVGIAVGLLSLIVIVIQKDMGSGLIILAVSAVMLYVAQLKMKYFLAALGVLVGAGLLFIVTAPHRMERIFTFFNHSNATDASNYHIEQALIAVGSGGFFGQGLAHGIQAFGYLPEAANDSIFAIVAEIFGFTGTVAILAIFGALIYRLLVTLDRSRRPEFQLIMAGVVAWVGSHIVINIAAMIGLVPLTGITLPFLSFGGTSLLFIMFIMGIAFNISHYTDHKNSIAKKESDTDENRRGGRGVRRPRHASSSRYQRA